MIRTRTTFILGPAAAAELHMPSAAETLDRVAQALDFSRASANQLTRDGAAIVRHVGALAQRTGASQDQLLKAAQRIHQSAKVARSLEGVIEQNSDDPLLDAFGKLALAVFTLQSEQRSSVRPTPQPNAALPLQTGDYWLLDLGKLIIADLPRHQLEASLADVAIVNFGYDRAVEHFLPFVLSTAYGMSLAEAQAIMAARLRIFHPRGAVGRLPWQAGDAPAADYGDESAANVDVLSALIKTGEQALADRAALHDMRAAIAGADRLVFLGCDFAPQSLLLLAEGALSHDPELIVNMNGLSAPNRAAAVRMLKRLTGAQRDDRLIVTEGRCLDVLKDFSLLLES